MGIFFLTPCPAKMTAVRAPQAIKTSNVDGVISIMEVYGKLNAELKRDPPLREPAARRRLRRGLGAAPGGEMLAVGVEQLPGRGRHRERHPGPGEHRERRPCGPGLLRGPGAALAGAWAGRSTFENTYVAKNRLRKLTERLPRISAPEGEERELSPEEMRDADALPSPTPP